MSGDKTRLEFNDRVAKSYTYLRTAMVALLVGLATGVVWQTGRQDWHLLGSVSGYYYTAAQTVFVGTLIGLGACMIALRGTRWVEEVLLNLGGVFAIVVAIVPTARDEDFRRALAVCRQTGGTVLNQQAVDEKCAEVQPLADAARASVVNSMSALLVVGGLALLATLFFVARERWPARPPAGTPVRRFGQALGEAGAVFWWGFGVAVLIWTVSLLAMLFGINALIDWAHYVAAAGLFACIVGVAVVNARRYAQGDTPPKSRSARMSAVVATAARHRYTAVAWAMLIITPILGLLWGTGMISLFWLEIFVALAFIVFWMVQTVELMPRPGESEMDDQADDVVPRQAGAPSGQPPIGLVPETGT